MTTPTLATTFCASSPEDILAAVPIVLGFEPEASLVMLTFGGAHQFHCRLDLPTSAHVAECSRSVLAPARHHAVQRVVFVVYGAQAALAGKLTRRLESDFTRAGIDVVECLRASGGRWFRLLGPRPDVGTPYDISEHPFRAQAVVAGRVTEPSRAAVAARLDPDPVAQQAVAAALRRAVPPETDETGALVDSLLGATASPEQIARLLLGVAPIEGRDRAWSRMSREAAAAHVELWTAIVRAAPPEHVAQAAGLLAFASWLAGHGALAWCAVDRCLAVEPDHRLGLLVAEVLNRAVAPTLWEAPSPAA